jgi:23S rRNA (pseudouridine1915-N3)-methyltransferase
MKIRVVCVGKHKDAYIADAVADFKKKIRPLAQLEIIEVKDVKGSLPKTKVLIGEAGSLSPYLSGGGKVILLDVRGKQLSTEQGSEWLAKEKDFGFGIVTFVIGGVFGVSDEVRQQVDETWTLSDFTLSHRIARVVLLEQLYRMLTLVHGIPYHK